MVLSCIIISELMHKWYREEILYIVAHHIQCLDTCHKHKLPFRFIKINFYLFFILNISISLKVNFSLN